MLGGRRGHLGPPYRRHPGEPRFTYGHSLICDPWGHVVAKVSDGTGWATARIDPTVTERVRRDMPVLEHRKLGLDAPPLAPVLPGIGATVRHAR